MYCQTHISMSHFMWAEVKVMLFVCYPLSPRVIKDYQARGVSQEKQGALEQMCVVHNHQHQLPSVLSGFLTKHLCEICCGRYTFQ